MQIELLVAITVCTYISSRLLCATHHSVPSVPNEHHFLLLEIEKRKKKREKNHTFCCAFTTTFMMGPTIIVETGGRPVFDRISTRTSQSCCIILNVTPSPAVCSMYSGEPIYLYKVRLNTDQTLEQHQDLDPTSPSKRENLSLLWWLM